MVHVFSGTKLTSFMLFIVIVYSNSTQDVVNPLLYQGFIEETVELLELDQPQFSVSFRGYTTISAANSYIHAIYSKIFLTSTEANFTCLFTKVLPV